MSMIVDFPSLPEAEPALEAFTSNAAHDMRRQLSVSFSPTSYLLLCHGQQHQSWHSADDRRRFKQETARDALTIGRVLAALSPGSVTPSLICMTVGLESLVSPTQARQIQAHKRNHVRAVLQAQGSCSEDELRIISQDSSRSSRMRATQLAAEYRKI
ncbi:hypothetical protein ACHAWF_009372 [Thalassiosira exigua]